MASDRAHLAFLSRHHLLPYTLDPLALQQLGSTCSPLRIPIKAPFQEVNAFFAQLLSTWQLGWIALRDVIHDGPLVVETGPGPPPSAHLEDDAPKGPDIDGA